MDKEKNDFVRVKGGSMWKTNSKTEKAGWPPSSRLLIMPIVAGSWCAHSPGWAAPSWLSWGAEASA